MKNLFRAILSILFILGYGYANAQNIELKQEKDGFVWKRVSANGAYGAQTETGETLIPAIYSSLFYSESGKCFYAKLDGYETCYEKDGSNPIPLSSKYTDVLKLTTSSDKLVWYRVEKNGVRGACDAQGRVLVAPSISSKHNLFYSEYDHTFKYEKKKGNYVSLNVTLPASSKPASASSHYDSGYASSSGAAAQQYDAGWYYARATEMLESGSDFYKDALGLFKKANELQPGNKLYEYYIGYCFQKSGDSANAAIWYNKSAERGYAPAQFRMGEISSEAATKLSWYMKAAQQGHVIAQYRVGNHYQKGLGVTLDYAKAVQWFSKAANAGCLNAQYRLGACYAFGLGVPKNENQAIKWLYNPVLNNNGDAIIVMGIIYYNRGDKATALELLQTGLNNSPSDKERKNEAKEILKKEGIEYKEDIGDWWWF